jgi:hypothetical protein
VSQKKTCFAQFFYRVNDNKTLEAICSVCFLGSDPALHQSGLLDWEKAHVCAEQGKSFGGLLNLQSGGRIPPASIG